MFGTTGSKCEIFHVGSHYVFSLTLENIPVLVFFGRAGLVYNIVKENGSPTSTGVSAVVPETYVRLQLVFHKDECLSLLAGARAVL